MLSLYISLQFSDLGEAFTCLETVFRLDALHRQMRLLGDNNPVSKLQAKFEPGTTNVNLLLYEPERNLGFGALCFFRTPEIAVW